MTHPRFSIVIPAHDEAANLPGLVQDLRALVEDFDAEVIVVNDGSDDNTAEVLRQLAEGWNRLRVVTHNTSRGQSAALRSGIRAARAEVIATLDGDGQNPPENLRGMFESFIASPPHVGMVQGERVKRKDSFSKRLASRFANAIRGFLLRDGCRDSGCALRVFWRQAYLDLPWFKHLHRFMPALMRRDGWDIVSYPVSHAHREWGASHYSNWQRGLAGIPDLIGVSWLIWRASNAGMVQPWWLENDEK
jgi:dolichol-phosphate mannosyltransferase